MDIHTHTEFKFNELDIKELIAKQLNEICQDQLQLDNRKILASDVKINIQKSSRDDFDNATISAIVTHISKDTADT